jgi:hypothetical protein
MSDVKTRAETDEDDVVNDRARSLSRYPGRVPVTVRTTELEGEEPSREERLRAGLRRLAQEGRIALPHD